MCSPHTGMWGTPLSLPSLTVGTQTLAPSTLHSLPSPAAFLPDRLHRRKNYVASLTEKPKADVTNFFKCSGTHAYTLHNPIRRSTKHFCPQVSSRRCWTSDQHKFFCLHYMYVHNTPLPLRQSQHQLWNYLSCSTWTGVSFSLLPASVEHPYPSHTLSFFLTQCILSEIPSSFLHPGCSNAPDTERAGGRGKRSTVCLMNLGRTGLQGAQQGCKALA